MTKDIVNRESKPTVDIGCSDNANSNEENSFYPSLETVALPLSTAHLPQTISSPATITQNQPHVRYGHSRNGSSVNAIITTTTTTTATTFTASPTNKPNAVDSLLKIFGFHGKDEKPLKQKNFCGVREAQLIMLFALIVVFLISGTVFFVMWFTEIYNDSIVSSLVLAKNSTALKYFINPPLDPQLRVHIFNYTNSERFLRGLDKKLIVKDVGPYVYTEKAQKVNVEYNDNNTISYQEYRSFEYKPELSDGKQYDSVIVPNIPLLTAAWQISKLDFLPALTMRAAIATTGSRPFVRVPAHSFMWGYDDKLIDLSKQWSAESLPFDKFGMLTTRNGTSRESFTINSGVDDIRKLNVIDNFNGEPRMRFWGTNECNRVDGTDGAQFPPHLMDKKQPLQVFIKAFCRKFPMLYDSEVSWFNGVPAWRYKAPKDVFDSPKTNPENQCYCDMGSGKCPPSGVFNATLCFDAPIYSSFPHFLYGDKTLFSKIDGLHPDENLHLTYADIHPRLAFPMSGSSRFQINVQVHKSMSDLVRFDDEQILPVMWMEVTSDEVPEELRAMIYHSTFSANAIQLSLRYGSLFGLAISLAMFVAGCYLKNVENNDTSCDNRLEEKQSNNKLDDLVTIDLNEAQRYVIQ